MRKFTLLIASLFMTIGAMAQFETGKEYRLKVVAGNDVTVGEYVTIGDNLGHAFGHVHTMALGEDNGDQKFSIIASNGNWKVKSANGEFFYYHPVEGETGWNTWNLNKTTNETEATEFIFESTGNANEYYIKRTDGKYFKVGSVSADADPTSSYKHVYADADASNRATFLVELAPVILSAPEEIESGRIYTFRTVDRGWLVANSSEDYAWSSSKSGSGVTPSYDNEYCQWVVYKTATGTYMYNVAVGKFITVGDNDNSIPLGNIPNNSSIEFMSSTKTGYPFIIGLNNKAVNLNIENDSFTKGAILWGDGWTVAGNYDDPGSSMKIAYVDDADAETLAEVAKSVSAYEDAPFTLNVTAAGYATLFLGFDAAIPAEVEAYIVKKEGINEGYIIMTQIEGTIPANTGVIVKAEQGDYNFNYSTENVADVAGNLLEGSVADEYVQGAAYVLSAPSGAQSVGLYPATLNKNATGGEGTTHFLNNANKAYLPNPTGSNVASYSFRFGEGTTGVDQITDNREQSTVIYDLTGRRVENPSNGIYIINGVKTLVK